MAATWIKMRHRRGEIEFYAAGQEVSTKRS